MDISSFSLTQGRVSLEAVLLRTGPDGCIIISGGDAPHIGASAAGFSGSLSVTSFSGHKEAVITAELAEKLQKSGLLRHFTLQCGIHVDDITKEEIGMVLDMCRELFEQVTAHLQNQGGQCL